MFPAARLTDSTATGDCVIGPGTPNVLIGGLPAACVGDAVQGQAVVGSITTGSATVLIGGRPAARVTSVVTGANPITGIPVASAIATGLPTVLIGG